MNRMCVVVVFRDAMLVGKQHVRTVHRPQQQKITTLNVSSCLMRDDE